MRAARRGLHASRTAGTASPGSTAARAGTPSLRAPLTQPGAGVKEGEYLLAVNGRELARRGRGLRLFEGTAGKQTVLKVGPTADGKDSREVTVVPVAQRAALRNLAWVDDNRREVDKLSGGRVAYVYLPDTRVRRVHAVQPLLLRPGRHETA